MALAEAESVGLKVQQETKSASLAAMRNVPADRLLALQSETQLMATGGGPVRVGPSIDGYFLPDTPAVLFAAHRSNDVPVIAGFANDESASGLRDATSVADFEAMARRAYGVDANAFLSFYAPANSAGIREAAGAAAREGAVLRTARNWAIAQSRAHTSPTYIYNLARVHPFNPKELAVDRVDLVGAYHTSDVPYWFGTLDVFNLLRPTRLWQAYDRELSQKMTAALIAFANSGTPTTADVTWPAWSASSERLLEFGDRAIAPKAIDSRRLDFMAEKAAVVPAAPRGVPGQARDSRATSTRDEEIAGAP